MEESAIQHLKSFPEVQKKGPEGRDPRKLDEGTRQKHKDTLREVVAKARETEFKMVEKYVSAAEEAFREPIVEIVSPTLETMGTLREIAGRLREGDYGTMTESGRTYNVDGEDYNLNLMVDDAKQRYNFLVKNEPYAKYPPETKEAMGRVDSATEAIGAGSKDKSKYADLDAALLDLQAVVIQTNVNQFDMGLLDMALSLQLLHDRAQMGGVDSGTKTDVQYFAASALLRVGGQNTERALGVLAPFVNVRVDDFTAMNANSMSEVRSVAGHFGAKFKGDQAPV